MTPGAAAVAVEARDDLAHIRRARDELARWLIDGPAQIREGPQAGAVAGETIDGFARYAYPEITGYYLQWLAQRVRRHGSTEPLALRAQAAQRWLAAWIARSPPLTRIHFDSDVADWRNGATFLFDLAMVLRGIASASEAGLLDVDVRLVERLCEWCATLIGEDGQFDAARMHANAAVLPLRWSTVRGAFLSKPTAAILVAARRLPAIPATLEAAATVTFEASIDAAATHPHAGLHPYLYALEGVLALPEHPRFASTCARMAAELERRIATPRFPLLAESLEAAGRPRLDVVAQALRAIRLMGAHGMASPSLLDSAPALAQSLVASVERDGGMRFALDDPPELRNLWTTMFAEQALDHATCDDGTLAAAAKAPLIV